MSSKQPEYNKGGETIISAFRRYILETKELLQDLPKYQADTRKRDIELRNISRSEDYLSGVLSTVVSRNANRSFSLVGGVRQVSKYSQALHYLNNGAGWQDFITKMSTSYYSTNFGYGAEIAFDEVGVPVSMFGFDSTRCKLTGIGGDKDGNLLYVYPRSKHKMLKFRFGEFIHDNSMPATEFDLNNAGTCAVERCLSAARIVSGIMQYYLDKLSVAPSQGVVLFQGMELEEFERAVEKADEQAKSNMVEFYKGVLALFTDNSQADIKLVSFSSLPENFEYKDFIEIIMQVYALAFNFPVGQFWSISSGSFGRTGEMKVQEQMATDKGELEFAISIQEQLHRFFLPETITFKFDVRNDSGDLAREKVRTERIKQMTELVKSAILTTEQARTFLAVAGDIPQEWAESLNNDIEENLALSREDFRKMAMENSALVARFIKRSEPIISYTWSPEGTYFPSNIYSMRGVNRSVLSTVYSYEYPRGAINVLFEDFEDAVKRRVF